MEVMKDKINLDKIAAEAAQEMVKKRPELKREKVSKPSETLERLVTKALGVLQSQGVYALILFLLSRSSDEKKVAEIAVRPSLLNAIKKNLSKLVQNNDIPTNKSEPLEVLEFYSKLSSDLDTLLLVRELYEQTLIYARYHAKALKDS